MAAVRLAKASSQKMTTASLAPTGDIVIEAWLFPLDISADQNWIFMIGNASGTTDYIGYTIGAGANNDRWVVEIRVANTTTRAIGSAAITTSQWYYVRFTRKSADGVITIRALNGSDFSVHSTASATAGSGALSYNAGAAAQFGLNIAGNSSFYDGRIAKAILLTSGIPSDADTLARAQSCAPQGIGSLADHWPLTNGTDTRDTIGSATLTMVNTPTTESGRSSFDCGGNTLLLMGVG